MPNDAQRLLPKANTAAIRCYGQGLGDCFLIAFPRNDKPDDPFYMVIDCGVAHGTPDEAARMQQVVADIAAATGGHLDVLAVTHQHYDHVIGFVHAEQQWKQIAVDQLFLAWTEKPGDADAATIGKAALRLSRAADKAAGQAERLANRPNATGLKLTGDLLAAGNESFGIGAAQGIEAGMKIALQRCPENRHVYCEPGDVLPLAGTAVKAYVLGPPRPKDKTGKPIANERGQLLIKLLEDRNEMYSYTDFGLTPDGASGGAGGAHALTVTTEGDTTAAVAGALLGSGPDGDADFDRYCPFDPTLRIGWDDALVTPFFWEHYTSGADWRRVDNDWLSGSSALALRAGAYTNNISLVLAFELPQSKKVLLFVGDAQVGNWLSWHKIDHWSPVSDPTARTQADIDDLLGRVAFYKVGHHGSHNATIRDKGLAKMPEGLLAFIPVSVPVAHDIMSYCPMPFYPVLRALQEKTGGAVFLGNGKLLEPLPIEADRPKLEARIQSSHDTLPDKTLNRNSAAAKKLEEAVPLWIEFTIDDPA